MSPAPSQPLSQPLTSNRFQAQRLADQLKASQALQKLLQKIAYQKSK
jgi:hypothetical protein